jgi:hypothetical protein
MVLAVIAVLTFGNNVDVNVASHESAPNYIDTFPASHFVIVFLSFFLWVGAPNSQFPCTSIRPTCTRARMQVAMRSNVASPAYGARFHCFRFAGRLR